MADKSRALHQLLDELVHDPEDDRSCEDVNALLEGRDDHEILVETSRFLAGPARDGQERVTRCVLAALDGPVSSLCGDEARSQHQHLAKQLARTLEHLAEREDFGLQALQLLSRLYEVRRESMITFLLRAFHWSHFEPEAVHESLTRSLTPTEVFWLLSDVLWRAAKADDHHVASSLYFLDRELLNKRDEPSEEIFRLQMSLFDPWAPIPIGDGDEDGGGDQTGVFRLLEIDESGDDEGDGQDPGGSR